MRRELAALLCGTLFGAGLAAAGMTDPAKVLAFLDLLGDWDPTLMFVMAAAVGIAMLAFRWILRRPAPLFDETFHLPLRNELDARLIVGAMLFGIGWGLYGYCPGPALGALAYGQPEPFMFVAAMLAGILADWVLRRQDQSA
jgi:uncharacterized membrane protein YedE/YeeE